MASPFNLTGSYLGSGGGGFGIPEGVPRVVPNPMDNTLLIQATPQEHEKILKLLKELDLPPRQVLIEAKIYEVSLTGAFASGVASYLQRVGSNDVGASGALANLSTRIPQIASAAGGGLTLTAGALIGQSRQLLGILTASEDNRKVKAISAPVIIATDSIEASINVGQDVPTLTSQAVTGVQSGGNSLFANTVSSRSAGVMLQILARVTPSGIVTLVINQEVSSPQAPSANAAIQSPSFQTRTISTQVTIQDGDTIAIGGIIQESDTSSSAGIPFLHRIPIIGGAFGAKSTSKERTELVIFMTPRVIYDTNGMAEASDEVKSKLKRLTRIVTE
jgi:general secretion pathway protein D